MSSSPVIFTLPQELLQHIIIVSAFGAPPSTIAAITETCKFFYSLVYNSTDHHLWREIFLAIFDDPRPLLGYLTTLRGKQTAFDWEKEFKSRMRAAQVVYRSNHASYNIYLNTQRPTTRSITFQMSLNRSSEMQSTLHTLLSVLETCLPFAWTTTVAFGPLPSLGPEIPAKYPSFPPLIILLSSSICNASDKAQFSRVFESTSAQWLEDVLRDGFPRVLTRKLLASPSLLEAPHGDDTMSGGVDSSEASAEQELKEWTKSEEARLFYKLVAHTGFIPVRKPSRDVEASQTSGVGDDDPRNNQASDDGDTFFTPNSSTPASSVQITPLTPPAMPRGDASVDAQFASARRMARRTVYDLRFLKPERMFGPFLPSPPDEMADKQDGPTQKKRHGSQADSDDGSDDPDYVYPGTDSDEDDTESVNDDGEDLFPLINLISPQDTGAASADTRLPSPHTLIPDWIWLAGARIIVEANLRDMLRLTSAVDADLHDSDPSLDDVANALRRMEGLRMGGAPGFWDGWTAGSRVAVHANGEIDVKGKTKATEASEGSDQGWDWAGAAGTWKRCICWLDYRDLLINNVRRYVPSGSSS
ncbi:hypothetical protein PILCRDRAFT_560526 [Piloderma croceum F 1598]|uniref:F-box domain-containing protein n=1 Tax=Piloderma croceum (strain F 1598) TaxID=765440 RepID=A0A0C3BPL8_PILCF|nr:hypothetical protein PILCRDRAFT_560526 [Piloderma croceum F 1598]